MYFKCSLFQVNQTKVIFYKKKTDCVNIQGVTELLSQTLGTCCTYPNSEKSFDKNVCSLKKSQQLQHKTRKTLIKVERFFYINVIE